MWYPVIGAALVSAIACSGEQILAMIEDSDSGDWRIRVFTASLGSGDRALVTSFGEDDPGPNGVWDSRPNSITPDTRPGAPPSRALVSDDDGVLALDLSTGPGRCWSTTTSAPGRPSARCAAWCWTPPPTA